MAIHIEEVDLARDTPNSRMFIARAKRNVATGV